MAIYFFFDIRFWGLGIAIDFECLDIGVSAGPFRMSLCFGDNA